MYQINLAHLLKVFFSLWTRSIFVMGGYYRDIVLIIFLGVTFLLLLSGMYWNAYKIISIEILGGEGQARMWVEVEEGKPRTFLKLNESQKDLGAALNFHPYDSVKGHFLFTIPGWGLGWNGEKVESLLGRTLHKDHPSLASLKPIVKQKKSLEQRLQGEHLLISEDGGVNIILPLSSLGKIDWAKQAALLPDAQVVLKKQVDILLKLSLDKVFWTTYQEMKGQNVIFPGWDLFLSDPKFKAFQDFYHHLSSESFPLVVKTNGDVLNVLNVKWVQDWDLPKDPNYVIDFEVISCLDDSSSKNCGKAYKHPSHSHNSLLLAIKDYSHSLDDDIKQAFFTCFMGSLSDKKNLSAVSLTGLFLMTPLAGDKVELKISNLDKFGAILNNVNLNPFLLKHCDSSTFKGATLIDEKILVYANQTAHERADKIATGFYDLYFDHYSDINAEVERQLNQLKIKLPPESTKAIKRIASLTRAFEVLFLILLSAFLMYYLGVLWLSIGSLVKQRVKDEGLFSSYGIPSRYINAGILMNNLLSWALGFGLAFGVIELLKWYDLHPVLTLAITDNSHMLEIILGTFGSVLLLESLLLIVVYHGIGKESGSLSVKQLTVVDKLHYDYQVEMPLLIKLLVLPLVWLRSLVRLK